MKNINIKTTLFTISMLSTFFLQGCGGAYNVKDISKYDSAIKLAEVGTMELSSKADNTFFKRPNKLETHGNINRFSTAFFSTKGVYAVYDSFESYCLGINGLYETHYSNRLCLNKKNKNEGYFYLDIITIQHIGSIPKVRIIVSEPINKKPSTSILEIAKNNAVAQSYERAKRAKEKNMLLDKEKLEAKKDLASSTHGRVIKIGTKICNVFNDAQKGFTEKFANNKIQIRLLENGKIIWDDTFSWYACKGKNLGI